MAVGVTVMSLNLTEQAPGCGDVLRRQRIRATGIPVYPLESFTIDGNNNIVLSARQRPEISYPNAFQPNFAGIWICLLSSSL